MLLFFVGTFFGFGVGFAVMGLIAVKNVEIENFDDYHKGYVDGWHDAGGKE